MRSDATGVVTAGAVVLIVLAAAIVAWPLLPIDETRYVGVAWEMWLSGDFLVPHLNGADYSHKPPLLFWLIDIGWAIFGVNGWWPRVVPALFTLGSAVLVARLARVFWPGDKAAATAAPVLLVASGGWLLFAPVIMFDIMLAFFALVGVSGIVRAWRGARGGWLLCGIGIGFGVLAKGPVVLLHVLVPAVLAPYWIVGPKPAWGRWYLGVLGAVVIGAGIALSWALTAAMHASEAYSNAIFWGQSANRMVNAFAHARPVYWYVPFALLLSLPWLLWPALWRGSTKLRGGPRDSGVRFCASWLIAVFAAFTAMSGKQVHYLLPLAAPLALLAAHALALARETATSDPLARLPKIAFAAALAVAVAVAAGLRNPRAEGQDLAPIAGRLKQLETSGVPLAHLGTYQDQYHFLGRLTRPLTVLGPADVAAWALAHPEGRVVVYFRDASYKRVQLEHLQRYRGHYVGVADAKTAVWVAQNAGCCAGEEM